MKKAPSMSGEKYIGLEGFAWLSTLQLFNDW
jgi:hypothetical protein